MGPLMTSQETAATGIAKAPDAVEAGKVTRRLLSSLIALMVSGLLAFGMAPMAKADLPPVDETEVVDEEEAVVDDPEIEASSAAIPSIELTFTFDANGGKVVILSKTVQAYSSIGTLPTPTRTNFSFKGWYTDRTGGTKITAATIVTEELESVLYAQWIGKSVTIKFDPGKGKIHNTSKKVQYYSSYGRLPTPKRAGYQFVGWYTKSDGGTKITATNRVRYTKSKTLHAHWRIPKYKVTFDPGAGTVSKTSRMVQVKSKYGPLPTPKRTNYVFSGWYTKKSGGTKVLASSKVTLTKPITLYAHWNKVQTKASHWVDVRLKKLTATLMDGTTVVAVFPISPGKPSTPTVKGTFRIYSKVKEQSMGGYSHVKWCSWFKGNYGFHQAYWHNYFGIKAVSHGCVNMRLADAKALFNWVKIGTIVVIK